MCCACVPSPAPPELTEGVLTPTCQLRLRALRDGDEPPFGRGVFKSGGASPSPGEGDKPPSGRRVFKSGKACPSRGTAGNKIGSIAGLVADYANKF